MYAQREVQQQRRQKVANTGDAPHLLPGSKVLYLLTMVASRTSQEEAADKRLQKEVQVTLYRNYRVGDFPDIQISYSSLITPLQALAQVGMLEMAPASFNSSN